MTETEHLLAKELEPADIVVFGGNGDLALRKIIPALYYRLQAGQLPDASRIILVGRNEMDPQAVNAMLAEACREHIAAADISESDLQSLIAHCSYLAFDAAQADRFSALKVLLEESPQPVRIFYLATPPSLFAPICKHLREQAVATPQSRVVLEKPIGHDMASFDETNNAVLRYFNESQIYRIDHYLGKETVQNLMVLRFGNALFERAWNSDIVDHVQITVAESIGVGQRYRYYDSYGALRDMVQNHLLQLLCMVAMEAPPSISADAVRDEKLKVLRALRPISPDCINSATVRGQYDKGTIDGQPVPSYLQDIGEKPSNTESFVALKCHVDNWRWSGVPFYLRTGKRLQQRYSEVVIQFRPVPHNIFPHQLTMPETNKLVIRLQPDEHVNLQINTKVPGPGGYRLKPVNLNLSLAEAFEERSPDAYERLLMDVVRGNQILFMRTDEVEAAWQWTEHILNGWQQPDIPLHRYAAGSWGPDAAAELIGRDGRQWYEDFEE